MLALAFVVALVTQSHATDLVLEARLVTPARLKVGEPVTLTMALHNIGKRALPVVKPGDGSESNWREPFVWYTAERQVDGKWVTVPKAQVGRCGLFDADWDKDTVMLAPGARLVLADWVDHPEYSIALDQPGHYRMLVHYAFGTATRSGVEPKGAMKGVAPFEVVSAPVTFELVR